MRKRVSRVKEAMDRLRREGVPGPCSCGETIAKFHWDSSARKFSPALCAACGKELPMLPFTEERAFAPRRGG